MYEYNSFASAVLNRIEFEFGKYRYIAGRTAEICLRLDEDFNEKLRREEVSSQRSYVLALTLKAATEYCLRENIDAATDTCTELFFNDVYNFVMDLNSTKSAPYVARSIFQPRITMHRALTRSAPCIPRLWRIQIERWTVILV